MKISHMTDVEQIETSIGQRNGFTVPAPFLDAMPQFVPAVEFFGLSVQWDLVIGGECSIACSSSCCETVAVPRFMTTIPPA